MNKEEELYVSLCNNPIIQEGWKPKKCDRFYSKFSKKCFYFNEMFRSTFDRKEYEYIFLPSLEQIIEAIGEKFMKLERTSNGFCCWLQYLGQVYEWGSSRRIACLKALLEVRKEAEC